eukprot:991104_1
MSHWAILKGSHSSHYLSRKKTRVGRDTNSNDVILLSQSISKRQCIIDASDLSNIVITDENSRNGTFVNNQRIQNATVKIKHGDLIRFGFDANSYRLNLSNKPPIIPLRTVQDRKCASFMIGSPPTSPNKYRNSNHIIQKDENANVNANTTHDDHQDETEMQSEKEIELNIAKDITNDRDMRVLQDTILRLENKIDDMAVIKEQHPQPPTTYPALIPTNKEKEKEKQMQIQKQQQTQKECQNKMDAFYDSVEKISIHKALSLLSIKIQYLCHLFRSIHDFNEQIPQFLDFSTRYKSELQSKAQSNTPTLTEFISLLNYLNDIFGAAQCTEISEFIRNTQSEILLFRSNDNHNRNSNHSQSRATQANDIERDNQIAVAHSMKQYSNTLQIRLYQLKQILMIKEEQMEESNKKDWVQHLESIKNRNLSLNRQILIQSEDLKRLYKMFSELSQRIDRNLPDSSILRSKINDFIKTYNTKLFHLTSQLTELKRRKIEKNKKWSDLNDKCHRYEKKMNGLETMMQTQRESFQKILKQKDTDLIKANKRLSVLSADEDKANEKTLAAKFLFETLTKYIKEGDQNKINIESLQTALQMKVQQMEEIQEMHQLKLNEAKHNPNPNPNAVSLHNGAERISKLEQMVFSLQTNLAEKTQCLANIEDENRKLSEKAPFNQIETIEFLSKQLNEKDKHMNKLQRIIDSQNIKIRELEVHHNALLDRTSKHEHQLKSMQEKHQRVNHILGSMKNIQNNEIKIHEAPHALDEKQTIVDQDIYITVPNS